MPRLTPDIFDQLVWPLTETSGPYRNVGQTSPNDSSTDLTVTNTVIRTGTGLFDGYCAQFPSTSNFPVGSSATRNYAAGAKNILIAPPITVSCWVYLRNYTTAQVQNIVGKEYRDSDLTSSWATPFYAISIDVLTSNGGGDWFISVATSASTRVTQTITDYPIPQGVWSHIGVTHDGTAIRAFLNGCQCVYYSGSTQLDSTASGTISYSDGSNGFGHWKVGAITNTGSTTKQEPIALIQDVRVANVARPLSYFKRVYAAGALPTNQGFASAQYYKLRAYDTSCVTPTAVVWVDTQVSLANAPPFPCSGPYTSPEVLDTWYV